MTNSNLQTQLQQKKAQLAAVREISHAIAEARDLDSTLDLITRRATEVMGVQSCSIYLYNKEETRLNLAASTGLNMDGHSQIALPAGEGLTGWAASRGEPVSAENAKADPRFFRIIGSGESKFASLLAMPLRTNGKIIGAANVQKVEFHTFSSDEIELFSFITDLAATAIEKERSVHAAAIQEIHHRVKNNLQNIAMLLRLQLSQNSPLTPTDTLHETINRVMSIAGIHEILAHGQQSSIGVKQLLEKVARPTIQNMTLSEKIELNIHGDDYDLPAKAATSLALTTNELIQNSIEHGFAGQDGGTIDIEITRKSHQLRLRFSDDGAGLSDNFNLDAQSGLGLELILTIVEEDLGGKFTLSAKPAGGALADIRVPMIRLEAMRRYD